MFQLLLAVIYLAFISLGLPDSLLGAAWPTVYPEFDVPVSYASIIYIIISISTIFSTLQNDRLTKWLGTGKVTAFSALLTATALFGFSISDSYWLLLLWAVPYGLGAGSVDASLNNYVALHYKSRHMSWLHCMWGVGASLGPYFMSYALTHNQGWRMGYRYVSLIQFALSAILMTTLFLWKRPVASDSPKGPKPRALSLKEVFAIPGAKAILLMFFCYCALEQTASMWASSFLVLHHGIDEKTAASFAGLFFIGLTGGRALSGFITMKLNDHQMIRFGLIIIAVGVGLMLTNIPMFALAGLVLIGLGCAPVYPCIIHSTPETFGAENSQAMIGVQMASAYTGNLIMTPLFGLVANHIDIGLFPIYLLLFLVTMLVMHVKLLKTTKNKA